MMMLPLAYPVCRVAPDLHQAVERAVAQQSIEKLPNSPVETVLDYWSTAGVVFLDVPSAAEVAAAESSGTLPMWRATGKQTVLLHRPSDRWDDGRALYDAARAVGATHVLPHPDWDDNHAAAAWADFIASLVRDHC